MLRLQGHQRCSVPTQWEPRVGCKAPRPVGSSPPSLLTSPCACRTQRVLIIIQLGAAAARGPCVPNTFVPCCPWPIFWARYWKLLHLSLTNWLRALLCQGDGVLLGLWRQKSPLFEDVSGSFSGLSLQSLFQGQMVPACSLALSGLKAYDASGFLCLFLNCLLIHIE